MRKDMHISKRSTAGVCKCMHTCRYVFQPLEELCSPFKSPYFKGSWAPDFEWVSCKSSLMSDIDPQLSWHTFSATGAIVCRVIIYPILGICAALLQLECEMKVWVNNGNFLISSTSRLQLIARDCVLFSFCLNCIVLSWMATGTSIILWKTGASLMMSKGVCFTVGKNWNAETVVHCPYTC